MKKDIRNQILELAQSIFDDKEYNIVLKYLDNDRLNDLRLFISDRMELCETVFILSKDDENLKAQIELLDELENIILEEYLENVE